MQAYLEYITQCMVTLRPVVTHYTERHDLEMSLSGDMRSRPKEKGTTIYDLYNAPHPTTKVQSMSKGKEKMIISNEDNDDRTNKFDDDYFVDL
ncbi:hypothetical protein PVK06_012312 [Gossypium arboreum]|uniref:Uncharacterized protein n=1 Tax=Gossypium arboreum TaxID=29729 RepID=A0ABR0QB57_GOSAR|nr:hypothetical protein PVK06_012312 [Gossypium arboreum]